MKPSIVDCIGAAAVAAILATHLPELSTGARGIATTSAPMARLLPGGAFTTPEPFALAGATSTPVKIPVATPSIDDLRTAFESTAIELSEALERGDDAGLLY